MRTLRPFARLFYDQIYRAHYFVVCCDKTSFHPTLRKLLRLTDLVHPQDVIEKVSTYTLDGCDGRIFRFPMLHVKKPVSIVIIWLRPNADITTLAHEAFHAARWVLEARGHDLTHEAGEEATAYYLQWIMRSSLDIRL